MGDKNTIINNLENQVGNIGLFYTIFSKEVLKRICIKINKDNMNRI